MQTATGFNLAEAHAAGGSEPKAMPMQILDYAAGHLLAFGIQAALWRQATQGGSWQVQVSLARVGQWLRAMPRVPDGLAAVAPSLAPYTEDSRCGFGQGDLRAMRHAPTFSVTPPAWDHPCRRTPIHRPGCLQIRPQPDQTSRPRPLQAARPRAPSAPRPSTHTTPAPPPGC
ncbi:MAG: hypothetical protein CFE45_25480 [Burkholderiales bacterium PBB5]|nr:MAG: hypothetical protein CFE45_25480 [Burkholderiales bacterium PBB5]